MSASSSPAVGGLGTWLPSLTSPNALRVDAPVLSEAEASNPHAKALITKLVEHQAHCAATDLQLAQLRCLAVDQKKALDDFTAQEARVAELEDSLEERTDELKQAQVKLRGLERDYDDVELRLERAAEDKAASMSELKRLNSELALSKRSNGLLKRRLEALGEGAATAYGLSSQGLRLRQLDLMSCVVEVHNATNMDVSLAGWTVRVVGSSHLLSGAGDQPDGVLVASSPKRGRASRRDSLVARRHAFYFPFDFMLAAGSMATIRWGPTYVDYGDSNQFHWQRPEDFDASDVVTVSVSGSEQGERLSSDDSGDIQGDDGELSSWGGRNARFAVSAGLDGGVTGLGAFPGSAPSAHTSAAATLGGWGAAGAGRSPGKLGRGGASQSRGWGVEEDPDAPLREGSMCLVDPNGVVTHAVPLLQQEGNVVASRRLRQSPVSRPPPSTLALPSSSSGFGSRAGDVNGGVSPAIDQVPRAGFGFGSCTQNSSFGGSACVGACEGTAGVSSVSTQGGGCVRTSENRPFKGDEVAEAAAEGFWSSTAAAALATPRRLGERFAAAHNQPQPEPSGRRWGPGGRNLQATPIPEPSVPDGCGVM